MAQWFQERAARAVLWQRSRPGLVLRALKGRPVRRARPLEGSVVRVAAVPRKLRITTAMEYAIDAHTVVAAAIAYGAQVICLPEYSGLHLVGLLGGEGQDAEAGLDQLLASANLDVRSLTMLVGPAALRVFETTWSTLARRFAVPIIAGSLPLPADDGAIYNTLRAYGPDGSCIAVQRKLNPFGMEQDWIDPGTELDLIKLRTTTLASPISMDHAYWETARLAVRRGAEVLVSPAATDGVYSWHTQSRGLWSRVQEVAAYGVQAMLVGDAAGLSFRGRSGIYAPLELSPRGDGVLAAARDEQVETIVAADLDLAALRAYRADVIQPRRELIGRYLPRLYRHEQQPEPENGQAATAPA